MCIRDSYYTECLVGLPELECTVSHLSSSAAKVIVLGLGARVEPSPLPAFKEAEVLFVKGITVSPPLASVPLNLSIPNCGVYTPDGT